jgi:NAD/NADP transhydrogenase beta subunit
VTGCDCLRGVIMVCQTPSCHCAIAPRDARCVVMTTNGCGVCLCRWEAGSIVLDPAVTMCIVVVCIAGSIVAFGKLQGLLSSSPLRLPGRDAINALMATACLAGLAAFNNAGVRSGRSFRKISIATGRVSVPSVCWSTGLALTYVVVVVWRVSS